MNKYVNSLAVFLTSLLFAACGGGGGATGINTSANTLVITGTAATGLAISGASVSGKCKAGVATTSTMADGGYVLSIPNGELPCVLQLVNSIDNSKLHSIVVGNEKIANITPLTEMASARVLGVDPQVFFAAFDADAATLKITVSSVVTAQSEIKTILGDAIDTGQVGNFISTSFKAATSLDPANGDGQDKILDALKSKFSSGDLVKINASLTNGQATMDSLRVAVSKSVSSASGVFLSSIESVVFGYYRDGSTRNPVSFIHPKDLDGDGIDEIFFVSFETQPNTPDQYSNTSVHILGWQNGVFTEITSKWLPNGTHQVEGIGDICFGDFNGDGKLDVFLSAYTDMNYPAHPYALMNQGGTLIKVQFPAQVWMHSVACGDINGDGYDDVYAGGYGSPPTYFGSATGLIEYTGTMGGSGATLGDFLGNGTLQLVATDAGLAPYDTRFYSIVPNTENRTVIFNAGPPMPAVRIDTALNLPNASHDIRARAVDFDSDGKLDVIVFSYRWNSGDGDVYRSEIQFLKNIGGGQFVDVTDTVRVGYDTHGMTGYFPQIRDFNGDGRVDIFVSQPDWNNDGRHRGSTLLLQNQEGQFVDTAKSELSSLIDSGGGQATMARGPAGIFYLVKESAWRGDGWTRVFIHPAKF